MIVGRLINKILNVFTGLFAIITLIFMLTWFILYYVNRWSSGWIVSENALLTIERLRNYFTLATVFCGGTEFVLRRNLILAIVFASIVLAVALFMVYTDVTV